MGMDEQPFWIWQDSHRQAWRILLALNGSRWLRWILFSGALGWKFMNISTPWNKAVYDCATSASESIALVPNLERSSKLPAIDQFSKLEPLLHLYIASRGFEWSVLDWSPLHLQIISPYIHQLALLRAINSDSNLRSAEILSCSLKRSEKLGSLTLNLKLHHGNLFRHDTR